MFGPVDWAIDTASDEVFEQVQKQQSRLIEANMFGPMDWAPDILWMAEHRGSVVLEGSIVKTVVERITVHSAP